MVIIGLTGGIASGKSTVAAMFAKRGAPVFDADDIAHQLVEPGQPALTEIIHSLGTGILLPDGRLDRTKLAERVFRNPEARLRLEAILHPKIWDTLLNGARTSNAPYCILVVPLLLETGQQDRVDRVLVVDCPAALQKQRAQERDQRPTTQIEAIIDVQVSREQRLAAADDIIMNDGDLARLEQQVKHLDNMYRTGFQS